MPNGIVQSIEVTHKENNHAIMRSCIRYARIVVWATMVDGKRVRVRTVEGGLDSVNVELKLEMLKKFFNRLVGHVIKFREGGFESNYNFTADKRSIPQKFLTTYKEIKKKVWNKMKRIRKKVATARRPS